MRLIHKLALRNLWRHTRRTLLTSSIIVLTFSLMIVFLGLSDGGHRAMMDIGIRMGLGHAIVQHPEYRQNPGLQNLIEQPQPWQQLWMARTDIADVVPRLRTEAVIQAGQHGVAVSVSGVVPEQERRVSAIANDEALVSGQTLAAAMQPHRLAPMVLGAQLAESLEVVPGDKVTLTVKPKAGSDLARAAYEVVGIFETGMRELDSFWVEVELTSLQQLAGVGDAVSMLALYARQPEQLAALLPQLEHGHSGQLEVLPWQLAAPELNAAITMDAAGMYLLMLVVCIVVAVGILNTTLMSAMHRVREFGVMMSVGASRQMVAAIVLWEAIYLSTFSIAVGLLLGLSGHYYFATKGLNFEEVFGVTMEASGVLLPDAFYSHLTIEKVLFSVGFVFLLTVLVSLYPALKVSRLSPVEASRYQP